MEIPGFTLETAPEGDVMICKVVGRVGQEYFATIEEQAMQLVSRGYHRMVVDLSEAAGISSSGLGLMLYYEKTLRDKGGCLVLVRPRGAAARTLSVSKLDTVFQMFDILEEALAAARGKQAEPA